MKLHTQRGQFLLDISVILHGIGMGVFFNENGTSKCTSGANYIYLFQKRLLQWCMFHRPQCIMLTKFMAAFLYLLALRQEKMCIFLWFGFLLACIWREKRSIPLFIANMMLCGLWNKDHASCIPEATLIEIGVCISVLRVTQGSSIVIWYQYAKGAPTSITRRVWLSLHETSIMKV